MNLRDYPGSRLSPLASLVALSLALSGCASKEYVQQEMGGVSNRYETLQNQVKELSQRIDGNKESMQQEMGGVSHRYETLQNQVKELSQRIDGNSVRLNHAEARLVADEEAMAALSKHSNESLTGLVAANQRIAGLSGDLTAASSSIAANAAEIARAHGRLDAVQAQAGSQHQETTTALSQVEQRLGATEAAMQTQAKALPAATPIASADTSSPMPASHGGDLAAQVDAASGRIAANSHAIAALSARVDGIEGRLSAAAPATDVVVSGVAATGAIAPATGEPGLAAANARIDAVRTQVGETQQVVATQATALSAMTQRVDGMSNRLDVADKAQAQSTTQVEQLQAGAKAGSERMSRNESDLAAASSNFRQTLDGVGTRLDVVDRRLDGTDKRLGVNGEHLALLQGNIEGQGARIEQNEKGLAQTEARLADLAAAVQVNQERLRRNEEEASKVSETAGEALDRAIKAGRLAEGKLVYETVLSEDMANFDLQQSRLSENSKLALVAFAKKLKSENQNVYIEIQGHTDITGSAAGNLRLGQERAETVRDFLHNHCGIALNRLSVISYGRTRPVASNATRAGRMKNRRVVLEVLK